jgi:hypothetical protein
VNEEPPPPPAEAMSLSPQIGSCGIASAHLVERHVHLRAERPRRGQDHELLGLLVERDLEPADKGSDDRPEEAGHVPDGASASDSARGASLRFVVGLGEPRTTEAPWLNARTSRPRRRGGLANRSESTGRRRPSMSSSFRRGMEAARAARFASGVEMDCLRGARDLPGLPLRWKLPEVRALEVL